MSLLLRMFVKWGGALRQLVWIANVNKMVKEKLV